MSVRLCAICETPILKGEPRKQIAGQPIHQYCDIEYDAADICNNPSCEWWRLDHGGPCQ